MIASKVRRLVAAAALVATAASTSPAYAGDAAAAAEVLFAEGKKLAQEGNYAAACPKLEESQKLDPGMGTLYRLGDCYEHLGRTASAWAAFVEVAATSKSAGQQARADDAKKRAADLEPLLSKLVVEVARPNTPGLEVKRGDVAIGAAQWGTPVPVDPGETTITAAAPGFLPWEGKVQIEPKATARVAVPELAPAPAPPPETAKVAAEGGRAPFGTQRTLAVVAGIAGLAGLGVGGAFGLLSMSSGSDADAHCDAQNTCDAEGLASRRDAITEGNVATVGFVAGGVLAVAAIVLWVTAPPRGGVTSGTLPLRRTAFAPRPSGLAFTMELP